MEAKVFSTNQAKQHIKEELKALGFDVTWELARIDVERCFKLVYRTGEMDIWEKENNFTSCLNNLKKYFEEKQNQKALTELPPIPQCYEVQ